MQILFFLFISLIITGLIIWVKKSNKDERVVIKARPKFSDIKRSVKNPVISPAPHKEWELNGTFNPAAFKDNEGNVHLLYRAIGDDGVSRVGHAISKDGIHFDERSQYPVFQALPSSSLSEDCASVIIPGYDTKIFTSGGSWSGSEDPRAICIDGKIYMSYVAFEGWHSVRIALTSISLDDAKNGKWKWKEPIFISPFGQVHKNWVIFPEKVNGKFAILHSIFPTVLVDYVDTLESLGSSKQIQSRFPMPKGGRDSYWDNWVRGAGPPPIRTTKGWLLLYHSMDAKNDPDKYKLGAMLLDLKDPTKVLFRSPQPILSPDMHYENDGKPGVVYASGAVVKGDTLYIYYGGGDKHVCVAQASLPELLKWLVSHGKITNNL